MRTLVLSSSQSKQPRGSDSWVQATLRAVDESVRCGHQIVTSFGLPSWEVALWRAASLGAPLHVVCPIAAQDHPWRVVQWLAQEFALSEAKVVWHWARTSQHGRKAAWALRDAMTIHIADRIEQVSVRPSGRLAKLLGACSAQRSKRHCVPFERPDRGMQWERRAPASVGALWPPGSLVHLTRASDGPWPGETMRSYYADVVRSGVAYARSGYATLCRMLREQRVRGGTFRSPGGVARVSFSSCSAAEVLGLIRFRARYARYSFEPYGIVLLPGAVEAVGARPVAYGARTASALGQGPGKDGHWRREREWRVLGDVDLGALDPSQVMVMAATEAEARALCAWSPHEVRSFGYAAGPMNEKIVREVEPSGGLLASKRV